MRKVLLPVVAAFVLGACGPAGHSGDGGGPPPPDSGILGVVTLGPMCPVERADSPCPDRTYQATLRILAPDGTVVETVPTRPDGSFRVAVQPGTYIVDGSPPATGVFPVAHPVQVTVVPHRFASVTVVFDTGIRMPVG